MATAASETRIPAPEFVTMCETGEWGPTDGDARPFTPRGPLPTEFGKDGINSEGFLVESRADGLIYRLMFRSELDNLGDVVGKGSTKRLLFERAQIFQAIDWERNFRKQPPLSADDKEHVFRSFVSFVFHRKIAGKAPTAYTKLIVSIK